MFLFVAEISNTSTANCSRKVMLVSFSMMEEDNINNWTVLSFIFFFPWLMVKFVYSNET